MRRCRWCRKQLARKEGEHQQRWDGRTYCSNKCVGESKKVKNCGWCWQPLLPSPELYGHKDLGSSYSKARDGRETLIFEMAKKHKIPMTGICRGSQFLNVMCGGTMVQHLKATHGGGRHQCETIDGKEFRVTSSHHQMSVPGDGGEVLAWARERVRPENCAYNGELPEIVLEEGEHGRYVRVTEAIHYPEFRIFAVQHHPEWQGIEEDAPQWTLNKIAELCWGQAKRTKSLDEVERQFEA